MRPFVYELPGDLATALRAGTESSADTGAMYIAGGTTVLDLMKLDVLRPSRLVDIGNLDGNGIRSVTSTQGSLRIGALATMADVAAHDLVRRDYPVIAQSLELAASAQLRNMARIGGNLLQRTRCSYFRDVSWPCNKREPGSGCSAIGGVDRLHAVLGASDRCTASYPGDFAQALIALDAVVEVIGPGGARSLPLSDLHRDPADTPHIETTLRPAELIVAVSIPATPWARRSTYVKVRDRDSYAFALASAAVALDMAPGAPVRHARIALGGVASRPWRARAAEASLIGKPLDEAAMREAADIALSGARPGEHNAFKIELGKQTVVRALMQARALEI